MRGTRDRPGRASCALRTPRFPRDTAGTARRSAPAAAPAQVRGLQLVCNLRFWGWGMGGGLPAAGAKMLAIFSVNHCILALKVMPQPSTHYNIDIVANIVVLCQTD